MAQLSRPFQIGLAGVVLLAAVWVLALRGHSGSSSSSSSVPPSVSTTATHSASPSNSASANPGSHASAPGVDGLSRAVSKAHEAVATSEHNASQLQQKSEQASSASSSSAPATQSATPSHATSKPSTSSSTGTATKPAKPSTGTRARSSIPAHERAAEAAMKKGDVVVLLFWDSHGSDDVAVHKAVQSLEGEHKLFVNQARANQVTTYGSITRGIQVYGTPTLLIVNPKGQTITLTGLQDAYAIRQAIAEARTS